MALKTVVNSAGAVHACSAANITHAEHITPPQLQHALWKCSCCFTFTPRFPPSSTVAHAVSLLLHRPLTCSTHISTASTSSLPNRCSLPLSVHCCVALPSTRLFSDVWHSPERSGSATAQCTHRAAAIHSPRPLPSQRGLGNGCFRRIACRSSMLLSSSSFAFFLLREVFLCQLIPHVAVSASS